jgi:hypothetical protein
MEGYGLAALGLDSNFVGIRRHFILLTIASPPPGTI